MFRFASPLFFVAVIVIPTAIWFRRRKHMQPALQQSTLTSIRGVSPSFFVRTAGMLPVLKFIVLALMITAMARPQWGTRQVSVLTEGINIILAVDLSQSMAALDFKRDGRIVDRLEAVKGVIQDFISKRNGDRIGMVVFGSEAFTQLPLTRDYNTISYILDRLEIGAAGPSTAIGDAIGISLKRLKDIKSRSNIIILLTDGQSNSGELSPEAAAGIAAEQDVKIYTIGVGSKGKAPFRVNDPVFGERYIYQRVDMDEAALKQIADQTGGTYFLAGNTEELQKIYGMIDSMEKTEVKVKTFAEYRELYRYFLIPAFLLLGIYIVLVNTRYLRVP